MELFDPNKSFIKLPIVFVTIICFGVLCSVILLLIILNPEEGFYFKFNLSHEGFNYAVTVFKVPLGIIASIIPIVALFAATHRSEQTKEQIRVASEQNKFSNYYKHKEEFRKYIKENAGNSKYPDQVHRKFYNGINTWTGKANIGLITTRIWTGLSEFINLYSRLQDTKPGDSEKRLEIMFLLSCHCTMLKIEFCLDPINRPEELKYGEDTVSMRTFSVFEPLTQFSYDVSVLFLMAQFDHGDRELKLWLPVANERFKLPLISFNTDDVNLYIIDEEAFSKFDFDALWDRINNFRFHT